MNLPEGVYRVRCVGLPRAFKIEVDERSSLTEFDFATVDASVTTKVKKSFKINFWNKTSSSVLLVSEDISWEKGALKPSHVLANPQFRDLFSKETLKSNVKLYLGEQTILFTDIVGSTVFYNTVGDAVMASFPSIRMALDCSVAILKRFP